MYKEGDACCQKLSIVKVSKVLPGSPTDSNITFSTLGAVSFSGDIFSLPVVILIGILEFRGLKESRRVRVTLHPSRYFKGDL